MLTAPSVEDLAGFTGRPVEGFSAFADTALAQATLLLQVVTKLTAYPSDDVGLQLATNAILEMADRFLLEQPYAATVATPFQSETIGSYSYSKSLTARKALTGTSTGLLWWDLAVDELTAVGESGVSSASIAGFTDHLAADGDGQVFIADPTDDIDPPYIRIS